MSKECSNSGYIKLVYNGDMVLNDVCNLLENKVFPIRSTNLLFNQYRNKNLNVDLSDADKIRKQNLVNYLKGFSKRPSVLIIGEAPGPRGCRFFQSAFHKRGATM